jgi:tetratricopeptide (TPR) repeat protein
MITKENILFALVGVLAGFMIGFFFANSVNQSAMLPPAAMTAANTAGMPSGHPAIPGAGSSVPEVQAAIDRARQNPDDFEAQMKAAELFYQIQRFDGAIEFLKRANELRPEDQAVVVNLGNANFDAGKYEEAEKIYARALAKKPEDLDVRTDYGLTFLFRDKPDHDRAIAEFRSVLERDANHIQALQNLAVAYTKRGDMANATAAVERLEQIDAKNAAIPKLREDLQKLQAK